MSEGWSLTLMILFFLIGYTINMFAVTALYHRGLAHQSVRLRPSALWFVRHFGVWMTGIDPLAWACMHRLHHQHSDTDKDPHSPAHFGVLGVLTAQMRSYEAILAKLREGDPHCIAVVKDIPFGVNVLARNRLWLLPYFIQGALCLMIGFALSAPAAGVALYVGLMTHPLQGWLVNAFAHKYGYVSYSTGDQSKNNMWVALLVFGEGLQNNHHAFPKAANFALKPGEMDPGFLLCKVGRRLGILDFAAERGTAGQAQV